MKKQKGNISMNKTLIAASVFALTAGSAMANPLSFGLDTDYASTEGTSTTAIAAHVDGEFNGFLTGVSVDIDAEALSDWYLGAHVGSAVVTYGDQNGVFSFGGGLNAVSGSVLGAGVDADRSLNIDLLNGLAFSVGLDTGTDIQSVSVVGEMAGVGVGLDYDLNAENYVLGASYGQAVAEGLVIGGIATYDGSLAGELNAQYAALGGSVNGFTTLTTDGFDAIGVGYDRELSSTSSLYIEGARDLSTDDDTIALGVSFSF